MLGSLPILPLPQQVERVPDKPAVIDDRPDGTRTVWTFAELNRQANRLAHVLRDVGVDAGDKVVWCGPNSPGVVRAVRARRLAWGTLSETSHSEVRHERGCRRRQLTHAPGQVASGLVQHHPAG